MLCKFRFFKNIYLLQAVKFCINDYLHVETVIQRCSLRKGVLRNFAKFTGKHLCQSLFFNKVATLLKKRLWHRCPPVNFAKFLRTPFLQNSSGRLLLVLVIARCWVEYGKYFTSLSYLADLCHEYLGKGNNRKMREWSKIKVFGNFGDNCFIIISHSLLSLPEKKN